MGCLRGFSSQVLQFFPLMKNQHFLITIYPKTTGLLVTKLLVQLLLNKIFMFINTTGDANGNETLEEIVWISRTV